MLFRSDTVDVESMFALKGLMTALDSPNLDCRQDGAKLDEIGERRVGKECTSRWSPDH